MPTLLLHILNEDNVMGDVDELPKPTDNILIIKNPRRKDGKDIHNIEVDVTTLIYPLQRILFIEVMPAGEEEEIIGFVRE